MDTSVKYLPAGWGPNQQADRAGGDYLHPAFVCRDCLNSPAGAVLVQS